MVCLCSLADFISGNQCSWIKRSFHSINDNWQANLAYPGHANVLKVVHDKWAKCWVGPVLLNIVDSYCKFREAFTKLQNNFKRVPFYCYKAFGYGRGIANKLDDEFFGVDNNTNSNKGIGLVKATWENITDGDVIQSMVTVGNFLGVELTREQYVNIRHAYKCAVKKIP